jgi:putative membrane protein insertion efficiency factor
MNDRLRRGLWYGGWPLRQLLLLPIRAYRLTVGQLIGGNCRFYPSCSSYAQDAIDRSGAIRGSAFALWRLVRCSPLSAGGIDHPPIGRTWRALHPDATDPSRDRLDDPPTRATGAAA